MKKIMILPLLFINCSSFLITNEPEQQISGEYSNNYTPIESNKKTLKSCSWYEKIFGCKD